MNTDDSTNDDFELARFPMRLNLPQADARLLDAAAGAVRREYRDSVVWKRLRCRDVRLLSESQSGAVFILEVGHAVEFDWTWEGAIAFRPLVLSDNIEDDAAFPKNQDESEIEGAVLWSGEILEVDEANGRIFVCVADPEHPPRTGSFYVRPFEFLAFLHAVYHEPAFDAVRRLLPCRLVAAAGSIHPDIDPYQQVGLEALRKWWGKSWSILWGPPGTGKTFTIGQQVACALADPSERILVLSTTNRATDAAALAIGQAATRAAPDELAAGSLLRIGKGASLQSFEAAGLMAMLRGTETEILAEIAERSVDLSQTTDSEEKALLRKQIKDFRGKMRDAAGRNFLDQNIRVVAGTVFRATTFLNYQEVKDCIELELAPFTTVFIDEAESISRAAVAALSLLASRRVVLVGDSKQLAPISRISRILPTSQMTWLASSGLSHLQAMSTDAVGVHVLHEQRRMHEDICRVVSAYQYGESLTTAEEVGDREVRLPSLLLGQPRTIWYVLDDDGQALPAIRAERGPGNRSWTRDATLRILERMFSDPTLRSANGLFMSPFRAQAAAVASLLASHNMRSWSASTVHSQQGAEADVVLFDTVNAGSYSWPYDEWQRLVNVAISRSREAVILLASRAEMEEPYLRPLLRHLLPRILRKRGTRLTWQEVPSNVECESPDALMVREANSIGYQISRRKSLRPVLSHEQQRLCQLELDGKPRLVRGVAGSGKTVVLAHWLMQTVKQLGDRPDIRIWAMFANRSLQSLVANSIEAAWGQETGGKPFPWRVVSLYHVREVLGVLLSEVGLAAEAYQFDYDAAAAAYLSRKSAGIEPRCDALFIDEAQDMGPNTLKLLTAIVHQSDSGGGNSRPVHIFYDNAQNIYGRATPTWSELGLDMRGRSTVMKESFRSTKLITEFALNVLYRLQCPDDNPDHKELVNRGLIELTKRNGNDWWTVHFNQIDGPGPQFRQFFNLNQEFAAVAAYCCELIEVEGVQPTDICLIYNGPHIKSRLENQVAPILAQRGVELSIQANRPFVRSRNLLLATTANSFKGYDAEVIIIPAVDQFTARSRGVLANNLYVATTRARSILAMFAQKSPSQHGKSLVAAIEACLDSLQHRPRVDSAIRRQDDLQAILDVLGHEHRTWLIDLWSRYGIHQEPLLTKTGEVVAEPLFWLEETGTVYVCFGHDFPRPRILQQLQDHGCQLLTVGEEPVTGDG